MEEEAELSIRSMKQDEVQEIALEWAAAEGWNPGIYDAPSFYSADDKGFFVGFLDDEPIACISAVAYSRDFGFVGFYIVKKEYRGRGFGKEMWETAMDYLHSQNVGLDGVLDQQANYAKSGFVLAHKNIRWEGKAQKCFEKFREILPLSKVPLDEIIRYDANLFQASRAQFLSSWIRQPKSAAFVAMLDANIGGYGVIRKCRSGYKIGPLFANNADLAEKIFLSLINAIEPGSQVFLDTPEVNEAAITLVKRYGMHETFQTVRMYTKPKSKVDVQKVFGITSFELG